MMKLFGRSKVSEFLGDFIVYRNLVPVDPRLPTLDEIRNKVDLPERVIPRKSDLDYAKVIVYLLKITREIDQPNKPINRLVFVGDTRLNDSTAFNNLCEAGGWSGVAFIASENRESYQNDILSSSADRTVFYTNRWAALTDFDRYLREKDFPIDESTVVIVDLDKTAVGARGRNAYVIDRARVQAVEHTVSDVLGENYNPVVFRDAYDLINQQEYHPFTKDNQDYLAYICLILGGGLIKLSSLIDKIHLGQMVSFDQFITYVNEHRNELTSGLRNIHDDIYVAVQSGDPTPFKSFRRNEYLITVDLMGKMSDDQPVEELLKNEIVITNEVNESVLNWRDKGALIFGLSDKPDEASIPTQAQSAQGFQPIHRTETHLIGSVSIN
jgi:hypothetical protein